MSEHWSLSFRTHSTALPHHEGAFRIQSFVYLLNVPIAPEGDQPWVFFERNDAKAETSVLWPPHAKS